MVFRLEKKRYIIGILALILVAILNLVPPKVMGRVIDRVTSGELTQGQLLMSLFLLVLSAFAMYFYVIFGECISWERRIVLVRLCVFAYLIILQNVT